MLYRCDGQITHNQQPFFISVSVKLVRITAEDLCLLPQKLSYIYKNTMIYFIDKQHP